jgi:hypothetical protein
MSTPTITDSPWIRLGRVRPDQLTDARLQVHHAAQIAVSAAISYLPAQSDDSHTALSWSAPFASIVTAAIPAPRPFRIALRPADLTLQITGEGGVAGGSFALPGHSIAEGHQWLTDVARSAGLDGGRLTSKKHYTLPNHSVAGGGVFSLGSGGDFVELERYWSNAALVLDEFARVTPGASPVRVWPHHFDIATLIALPANGSGSNRTIGAGHSPGDAWYGEPYWYIGPYPYPSSTSLPPLEGGHWHVNGWVGAALLASDYVDADAPGQRRKVDAFVESAVRACRALLGEHV